MAHSLLGRTAIGKSTAASSNLAPNEGQARAEEDLHPVEADEQTAGER